MKLKALLFSLPLLAIATIFTFCTKESSTVLEEKSPQEQVGVGDRGNCFVTVTVNYGEVSVCGTNLDLNQCGVGQCFNNPLFGTQILAVGNAAIYNVTTPGSLIITDTGGPELSQVTVSTGSSSITTGVGVGDGDKEFCVSEKCGLTLIR